MRLAAARLLRSRAAAAAAVGGVAVATAAASAPSFPSRPRVSAAPAAAPRKPTVLVLGSGWGAFACVRELDRGLFDVHIVSPRNHLVFTPLLASTAVGTLDFRSVAEPVRVSFPHVEYTHAAATAIDPHSRTVRVETRDPSPPRAIDLPYDVLVIATGARVNTFGVKDVEANAHFLKELADAREIRQHLIRNVEAATFPGVDLAEKARLLHCVIVGGGPTGIELAAEMHDFLRDDLTRLFPEVAPLVKITIIEALGSWRNRVQVPENWTRTFLFGRDITQF